jgi:prevent-host-death family protein
MKRSTHTVGAFEAKTKLGELLERVGQGASFTITKHERPVARLVAYAEDREAGRKSATTALRSLRGRYHLRGLSLRKLKDEGRR